MAEVTRLTLPASDYAGVSEIRARRPELARDRDLEPFDLDAPPRRLAVEIVAIAGGERHKKKLAAADARAEARRLGRYGELAGVVTCAERDAVPVVAAFDPGA